MGDTFAGDWKIADVNGHVECLSAVDEDLCLKCLEFMELYFRSRNGCSQILNDTISPKTLVSTIVFV
jgi:hypothetical protein